ncbi:response regulator [bacterium]|nr:response regulator [bacterium]MBU1614279.1 response regulator [bacterium]
MKRILVVDDKEKIRNVYTSLLKAEGFEVSEASSAVDAWEILKKEPIPIIDLILLDIKMPKVEGDDLYEIIRAFHKRVKVIVASVYPVDEQKRIIKDAADYYDKSQGIDVLVSKIRKVLQECSN